MRLSDVMQTSALPQQKHKRRPYLLYLFALVGLGLGLWRQGPGVAKLSEDEVAVIANEVTFTPFGKQWFGPKRRTVSGPGFAFYVPVAHQFYRISSGLRTGEIDFRARTSEGVTVVGDHAYVTWRVLPEDAELFLEQFGPNDAGQLWVESEACAALTTAFEKLTVELVQNRSEVHAAQQKVAAELSKKLKQWGVTLVELRSPSWHIDGEPKYLSEIRASRERYALLQVSEKQHKLAAETARTNVQKRREQAFAQLQKSSTTAENAADLTVHEAEQRKIESDLEARLLEVKEDSERRLLRIEAQREALKMRIQGLEARKTALGSQYSRALDRAIAEHLLPQLSNVSLGKYLKSEEKQEK